MTVNMDTWNNGSESNSHNEKQSDSLHSDDSVEKQDFVSVINNGPKENEPNKTIPSLPEKSEHINTFIGKIDTEKEDVSVPPTPCKCTLCDVVVTSPHSLTQHIRQHNVNNQTNTCRLCRKTLSSASSLDRHMLVHSGERPFKCRVCNMAFTTNGNMHRHMRTHGEATVECSEICNENKESKQRSGLKRRFSSDSDSSYSNAMESRDNTQQQKELVCPVCGKTFLCKYGLHFHMETHPNDPIRCPDCLVISPDYSAHIKHQCLGKDKANGNTLPVGFHDLSFVDFSSDNFSLVAKAFCEHNTRRPSSAFHKFECIKCNAAFPCGRALHLHEMAHGDKIGTYCPSCKCDFPNPNYLYAHQLKHRSAEHCWSEVKFNSNKSDSNKDDFLVLFGLKTSKCSSEETDAHLVKEEQFDSMSYFVFGKNGNEEKASGNETQKLETNKQNINSDFADIQSIISLTSKTPLMSCVRSSPAMASPASPPKVTSCALPESPPIADSAQASPETPSKDDDYMITNEVSMQNDNLEETTCVETISAFENPSKRQKTTVQSKSYSCHKCKYTSLDKGTLRRHLRTHNGERPFQCTICSYAFTTKANCERHVKKCHKITSKEDISCAMRYNPNMTETKDPDIQTTENTHLETICKYCNVDFKNQRVLRHHLRSLNNSCSQKPFLCTICKSGFSTKNNCMRHVAKQHPHLKEKPSEAVLMTASNINPSDHESLPLSDSGISSFTEEPLNLSVRESISDMEMDISSKSELGSIEDIVNAAKGLVCLSEMPPPQEQPLDLAIHPLDLTTKSNSFHLNDNKEFTMEYISSTPNNVQSFYFENSCSPHADLTGNAMTTSSPILSDESQQTSITINYKMNNDAFLSNTDRPFICKYCSSGFTLKSNMERHIKRKHPQYARPTRSRNYVSTVSLSNEKTSNNLAVSTQTRNALRFVLSNKGLSSTNQELIPENLSVQQENEDILPVAVRRKFDSSESNSPAAVHETKDVENAVDLASISDVIDTANSQEFKQYLKESRTDTKPTSETIRNKAKKSSNPTSLNIDKFIRKRNSYADSPNSIACPYCKRKFPWRSSLRRHVLTHTGQKPFKCPKCPIWFTTKSNCERHFGRKHKVNNDFNNRSVPERPYKCHLCTSSTFSTQGNLRKHFYLKHWTKTGSGRYHLSEFLSKDTHDTIEHESTKEIGHLPVISECNILNKFRANCGSSDRVHAISNIIYCCHICYKKTQTKQECLDHLENSHSLDSSFSHQNSMIENSVKDDNLPTLPSHCENEQNLNEEFINSGNITDSVQSKIGCMFCSNLFSFREEYCLHMKAHIKKLENNEKSLLGQSNEQQDIGQNSLCNSSLLNTRNRRSNSLLYLMQSGKTYNSAWNISEWNGNQHVAQNEDNTDLIQNLLGIQDSKMIDEMLDSADSAARLLGVEEV